MEDVNIDRPPRWIDITQWLGAGTAGLWITFGGGDGRAFNVISWIFLAAALFEGAKAGWLDFPGEGKVFYPKQRDRARSEGLHNRIDTFYEKLRFSPFGLLATFVLNGVALVLLWTPLGGANNDLVDLVVSCAFTVTIALLSVSAAAAQIFRRRQLRHSRRRAADSSSS